MKFYTKAMFNFFIGGFIAKKLESVAYCTFWSLSVQIRAIWSHDITEFSELTNLSYVVAFLLPNREKINLISVPVGSSRRY